MKVPTVRSLAAELGLSRATVAEVLRGSRRFSADTIRRVGEAARRAGYRRNPLVGAVMSEVRRSRSGNFRGVVAAIDLNRELRPAGNRYDRLLLDGAKRRAAEMGFKLETYPPAGQKLDPNRLQAVLQARGIQGIFLLPALREPDLSQLDWSHFAGIYTDYSIHRPALHVVCPDHSRAIVETLHRLERDGFRRVGLVVSSRIDQRIQYHWAGGFLGYRTTHRGVGRVPPLLGEGIRRTAFVAWFRRFRPDVVLAHQAEVVDWMESCGARVPSSHGFVCLNTINQERPTAGLDLQPGLIGARAVENVIAQVQRGEFGIPEHPSIIQIPAVWKAGPTYRARAPAKAG
jgi:LacI family transcriptional regulator